MSGQDKDSSQQGLPPPPPPPPPGQSGQSGQSGPPSPPPPPPGQPVPGPTGPTGPAFSVDGKSIAPTPQDSKKEEPEEDEQKISAAREMLSDFADEIHASKDDSIKKGMQILMMLLLLLFLMLLMILFGTGKAGKWLGEKLIDAIKDKFKDDPETVKQLNALKEALRKDKLGDELDKRLVDCLTNEQKKQYEALSEPGKFEFLERLKQDMGILPNNQDAIKDLISKLSNARKNPDAELTIIQNKADAIFNDPLFKERDVVGKDVCVTFGTDHSADDDEVTAAYKKLSYEQKVVIAYEIAALNAKYSTKESRKEPEYDTVGPPKPINDAESYPEGVAYIRDRIKRLALENTPMTSFYNGGFGENSDLSRSVSNSIYDSTSNGSFYEELPPFSVNRVSNPMYDPLNRGVDEPPPLPPRRPVDRPHTYEEIADVPPGDGNTGENIYNTPNPTSRQPVDGRTPLPPPLPPRPSVDGQNDGRTQGNGRTQVLVNPVYESVSQGDRQKVGGQKVDEQQQGDVQPGENTYDLVARRRGQGVFNPTYGSGPRGDEQHIYEDIDDGHPVDVPQQRPVDGKPQQQQPQWEQSVGGQPPVKEGDELGDGKNVEENNFSGDPPGTLNSELENRAKTLNGKESIVVAPLVPTNPDAVTPALTNARRPHPFKTKADFIAAFDAVGDDPKKKRELLIDLSALSQGWMGEFKKEHENEIGAVTIAARNPWVNTEPKDQEGWKEFNERVSQLWDNLGKIVESEKRKEATANGMKRTQVSEISAKFKQPK